MPAAAADDVAGAVPSKIMVDDRTNTLIVVSGEPGYLRVKALVSRLDIQLDAEGGSSINVYPLQSALAEELATTLNNALGQQQQAAVAAAAPARPGRPVPVQQSGPLGDGTSLEGQVRIIGGRPCRTAASWRGQGATTSRSSA